MQHIRLTIDSAKIAWLTIDVQQSPVNVLSREVLKELSEVISQLPKEAKGLVLCSGKRSGFIAGADIRMFESLKTPAEAKALTEEGRAIVDQLNRLPLPTVAMIEGFCLGGGLELALACRHRLALDDPKTRLGLPEVMLGIYPGWGGTVYLPKRIGDLPALQMMLTGKTVDARAAKKMGLVDDALPARVLHNAARAYAQGSFKPTSPAFWQQIPESPVVRAPIALQMAKTVRSRAPEKHYPAPYAIIALWRDCAADPLKAPANHPGNIEKLAAHPTTANLLRVFRLQERLKAEGKSNAGDFHHLHVIGAGTMGGDIAAWAALRGLKVTLADFSAEALAKSLQRAHQLFKKRLKASHLVMAAMDRLIPDIQGTGLKNADVIIEAIVENEVAKTNLFQNIERQAKKEAILATNTSTIPLERLALGLQDPSRLVGLHFFNPVARMPLVEIVHNAGTKPEVLDRAKAFVGTIDRLPLLVKSAPGFLVNRILVPYLMEAMMMLQEGVPAATIDAAAKDFGMPMGPIALADTVGLDICLAAGLSVKGTQAGTSWVPPVLLDCVRRGKLGVKSGEGFYRYKHGKPISKGRATFTEKHQWRLMLPFLNEAVAALREKIVEDADLLDGGVIFGTGFAPFRGGPMHYIRSENKEVWLHRMEELAERHGSRFVPDEGWNLI
jgi:3-hydroxyacyl-CoA dehydrogenase/enoyl-CoA hydratase/3-hydroxybutyryl-CoA epimerase